MSTDIRNIQTEAHRSVNWSNMVTKKICKKLKHKTTREELFTYVTYITDTLRQSTLFTNLSCMYTRSRITRTRLYRIIAYFEGHLPHQKSLH